MSFARLSAAISLTFLVLAPAFAQKTSVRVSQVEIDLGSHDYLKKLSKVNMADYKSLCVMWSQPMAPEDQANANSKDLQLAQQMLAQLGFGATTSGKMDEKTHDALRTFQEKHKILATSELDALTYWAIDHEVHRKG